MIRVRVEIMPKKEILDPQGRAVHSVLQNVGAEGASLQDAKVGKLVVLEFSESIGQQKALGLAQEYGEKVLANPLIESFKVEVISNS